MTKEQILEWFYINNASLDSGRILLLLSCALVLALGIAVVYRYSYSGVGYNANFSVSIIVIMLVTTIIMMMISSNIVISLGMVGALSIVRFRTAVKDSRDTIFVFWAVTEGLCTGSQNIRLAIISTVFVSLVLLFIKMYKKGDFAHKRLIIIVATNKLDKDLLFEKMDSIGCKHEIKSIKANRNAERSEIVLWVMRNKKVSDIQLIDLIMQVDEVQSANILLDSLEGIS